MEDVAVILPALDEAGNVRQVVEAFRKQGARVILVDNGSRDGTGRIAREAGAEVVLEPRRGYGAACLAGIRHAARHPPSHVVFADCDGTLDAQDLPGLLDPLRRQEADLVLGRRVRVEPGALSRTTRLGNVLACASLRLLHGLRVHDVPPYRAVTWTFLGRLHLREPTYGLPMETLANAARRGGRVVEVDVAYRRRGSGKSKVTGDLWGAIKCFAVITGLALRLRFRRLPE